MHSVSSPARAVSGSPERQQRLPAAAPAPGAPLAPADVYRDAPVLRVCLRLLVLAAVRAPTVGQMSLPGMSDGVFSLQRRRRRKRGEGEDGGQRWWRSALCEEVSEGQNATGSPCPPSPSLPPSSPPPPRLSSSPPAHSAPGCCWNRCCHPRIGFTYFPSCPSFKNKHKLHF